MRLESWSGIGVADRAAGEALTIERRQRASGIEWCEFRCRSRDGALRQADFVAMVLGYETFLCKACAKSWPAMWNSALAGFPDELEVAA